MTTYLGQFKDTIIAASESDLKRDPTLDGKLLIGQLGSLAVSYAPFEHIQIGARIVLAGITPGAQQASNALIALRSALKAGRSDAEALASAKVFASFSGAMRSNLVAMIDYVGLNAWLGIQSAASLWGPNRALVNFTSAIRYPTFVDGKNFNGKPPVARTSLLKNIVLECIEQEHRALPNAVWVPLGPKVAEILALAASEGVLSADRLILGLQHPSGANAERIAYFLGRKSVDALSAKTNPFVIDAGRAQVMEAVKRLPTASGVLAGKISTSGSYTA